ncbi:MAG: hypothetical protein APF76_11885 [Desulfitibacter sp. BRH_c19]|nr:MAG: hypothetical protein APF76_11885 [Desulfitibacter sp. BRH_c19]
MSLKNRIEETAFTEGLDIIRFTNPGYFNYALPESPRSDPRISLPSSQTLIICGIYIGGFEIPDTKDPNIGQLSRLILSSFYFDVVKPLDSIKSILNKEGYTAIQCDGYSDKSILPLKLAAVRAGIGWQGKNSLLISKEYGSFIALGGIITDALLEYDRVAPQKNLCGDCDACRTACPLNALEEPYKLNVSRCLSSLLEGEELSEEIKNVMGNKILECDLCQLACPWNKKLDNKGVKSNYRWSLNEQFGNLNKFFNMNNLIKLTEEDFNKYLGYALVGVNYNMFRRNLMAAMENSVNKC